MSFSTEDEVCEVVLRWFEENRLTVARRLRVEGCMELDAVAVGDIDIFGQTKGKEHLVYAVECKLAYTRKLIREAVEEAILRLAVADYVLIATPYKAYIWVSEKEQKEIVIPSEVLKLLRGRYSGKIGLIVVDGAVAKVVKEPKRSRLYIPYAKETIIKHVLKKKSNSLLKYKPD